MDDGEQNSRSDVGGTGGSMVVATTLATLLLAGSAYIWRSNVRKLVFLSSTTRSADVADGSNQRRVSKTGVTGADSLSAPGAAGAGKGSRSKERRRRGKDPMKDIMKGGKRAKVLLTKLNDTATTTATQSSADLPSPVPSSATDGSSMIHSRRTREHSLSTSSRSVSSTSSSSRAAMLGMSDAHSGPYDGSGMDTDSDDMSEYPPTPTNIPLTSSTNDETASNSVSESSTLSIDSAGTPTDQPGTDPRDAPSLSSSNETTPTSEKDQQRESNNTPIPSSSQSLPNIHPKAPRPTSSTRQNPTFPSPFDWDPSSILPPSNPSSKRKPPRLRSKSRTTSSGESGSIVASVSMPASFKSKNASPPPLQESSSEYALPDDSAPSPSSPSINNNDSTSASADSTSTKSPRGMTPATGGNSPTPKRGGGTPRRTPTPSSSSSGGTPPPSLSTQTQIASLRGALEAARMREEKMKTDLERCTKEVEMMRWETSGWRRREVELQTQIHHLVHQLQSYATLFMSMSSPHGAPLQFQPTPPPPPPPSGTNGDGSGNGSPSPAAASPPPLPPPIGIHILPNGMMSPMSPHSPFFGYPGPPPPPPPPTAIPPNTPNNPNGNNTNSNNNNNLFSLLFPHQPQSPGSSSPESGSGGDRGRRRVRTANADFGGSGGWVSIDGSGGEEDHGGSSNEDDETDGVDSALADAILKRPEAMKSLSSSSRKKSIEEKERVEEFTFPSLIDFGGGGSGASHHQPKVEEEDREVLYNSS